MEWYNKHLDISTNGEHGAVFQWKEKHDPAHTSYTVWGPFKESTAYFKPSDKEFMFNYRVENLVELLEQLKQEGVQVVGEIEEYDYGKFSWIMDPEGNKIELWEPNDEVFGKANKLEK